MLILILEMIHLYPFEIILNLLKENKNKIVSLIPDLKINTKLKSG